MIKIEIMGPNGENLLSGTLMEKVRRLGLPVVGLMGGMVLSFLLASSLVGSGTGVSVEATLDESPGTFRAGVDYSLPAMQEPTALAAMDEGRGEIYPKVSTSEASQISGAKAVNKKPVASSGSESLAKSQTVTTTGVDSRQNSQNHFPDPLLEERVHAARDWLGANQGDGTFGIQLMSVQRASLGEGGVKEYLALHKGLSADKVYAFLATQDRLLLYYGRYSSYDEAVQAMATLPASIRNTGPYVLSGRDIQGKLARLNKDPGKQVGLVAALKQ
ncbi:MAG: hypothetical protein HW380_422 [Magnetococcales bacterium]|nr:hypothetical protein [Magnetococcales bacterium]HIJ84454.1 hypothetical protein [Magnetococcales bacterium]